MSEERRSPHFFERAPDGSVRVRLNLTAEEADNIVEAAGGEPPQAWVKRMLVTRARYHIRRRAKAAE